MCVIISKHAGQVVPPDIVEDCYWSNPDGFGAAWIDGSGRLRHKKGLFGLRKISRIVEKLTPFRAFIHFRIRTAGEISRDGCHPYPVAGGAAYLMHNGCLDLKHADPARSDTAALADILQTWQPGDIVRERDNLADWHGSGNRLAFLFADGTSLRTGTWRTFEGLQFSNLHWQNNFGYCSTVFRDPAPLRSTVKRCQWCELPGKLDVDGLCDDCAFRFVYH